MKSTEPGEQQVSATQRKIAGELVRHATGPTGTREVDGEQAWVCSQVFTELILQDSRNCGV